MNELPGANSWISWRSSACFESVGAWRLSLRKWKGFEMNDVYLGCRCVVDGTSQLEPALELCDGPADIRLLVNRGCWLEVLQGTQEDIERPGPCRVWEHCIGALQFNSIDGPIPAQLVYELPDQMVVVLVVPLLGFCAEARPSPGGTRTARQRRREVRSHWHRRYLGHWQ